jgi:hypothetical protein
MSKYWTFSFRATVPFVHSYTVKAKDEAQAIEIAKSRMEAHDPVRDWRRLSDLKITCLEQKEPEIQMTEFIKPKQEEGK